MLSIKHKYLIQRLNVAFGHLQRLELAELLAAERGQDGAQPLERRSPRTAAGRATSSR